MLQYALLSFSSSNESNAISVFSKKMYASHSTMSKVSYVQHVREPSHPLLPPQGPTQSLSGIRDFHSVTSNSYYMANS